MEIYYIKNLYKYLHQNIYIYPENLYIYFQQELNKKREAEIARVKRDMEELAIQSDQAMASMKKKQQDAINELADQVDNLGKVKSKVEKERNQLKGELGDLQGNLEHVQKGKVYLSIIFLKTFSQLLL